MSISLLRNVAPGLISVFLKSTIKVISSRFTLGFHGSILQHILIPYLGLILTLTPQLIMCSVASMRWWPHNFAGSIISDDQNRCKSVSPWLPDNGGGCVSDWNSESTPAQHNAHPSLTRRHQHPDNYQLCLIDWAEWWKNGEDLRFDSCLNVHLLYLDLIPILYIMNLLYEYFPFFEDLDNKESIYMQNHDP